MYNVYNSLTSRHRWVNMPLKSKINRFMANKFSRFTNAIQEYVLSILGFKIKLKIS